jgi:hypothetical protein
MAPTVSNTGVSLSSSNLFSNDDSDAPVKIPKMCSYDIGDFLGKEASSFEKQHMLTHKWTPTTSNFVWPSSTKKQNGKVISRHLMQSHIDHYPQFAYSEKLKGLLCKLCVLSKTENACHRTLASLGYLVTKAQQRYDRLAGATGDLQSHLNKEYHKFAEERCNSFLQQQSKATDVYKAVNIQHTKIADDNRMRLIPIVKTIAFCGQNNIALRGNVDSGPLNLDTFATGEGNFRRLLKFRVDAGDTDLREYISNAPRNACYTSPEIQNIITCIGEQFKDNI